MFTGAAVSPRPLAPKSTVTSAPAPILTQDETVVPVFNQLRNGRKGVFKPAPVAQAGNVSNDSGSSSLLDNRSVEDDDVPLAQRIPGALQAQKSIRRQVRDEREKRRRERSVAPRTSRAHEVAISPPPQQHLPEQFERGRTITARLPKGAALGTGSTALSSSREAALMAQQPLQVPQPVPMRRPRAKTIGESNAGGVAPDDLTRRLLNVQARAEPVPSQRHPPHTSDEFLSANPNNRPSFDRASTVTTTSRRSHQSPHSPQPGAQPFQQQNVQVADTAVHALRPMRSVHGLSPAAASNIPLIPGSLTRRPTSSRGRSSQDVTTEELVRSKTVKSARTSLDKPVRVAVEDTQQYHQQARTHHHQQPPVPPLPVPNAQSAVPSTTSRPTSPHRSAYTSSMAVQTRVYIGDMQRFNVIEVGPETSAKDVLEMLAQQGDLRGEERQSNSWMLYEVCHDFGLERPIRNFELVADVSGSWSKEKTTVSNCIMVKCSPFALSLANIPSSIPTRSGYVDYESKKGKWNRRWLQLREHGLWLSKREGKDDEFLCSLSAFDAYIVTRIHKSPKTFSFAVKSTDPITLFENRLDYLHVFSCPEDTGRQWIESIMVARSYILYQEKNVLFRNKSASTGQSASPSNSVGAALSRAGTRKRPPQTYVILQTAGPFEPGSLLAKRSAA